MGIKAKGSAAAFGAAIKRATVMQAAGIKPGVKPTKEQLAKLPSSTARAIMRAWEGAKGAGTTKQFKAGATALQQANVAKGLTTKAGKLTGKEVLARFTGRTPEARAYRTEVKQSRAAAQRRAREERTAKKVKKANATQLKQLNKIRGLAPEKQAAAMARFNKRWGMK